MIRKVERRQVGIPLDKRSPSHYNKGHLKSRRRYAMRYQSLVRNLSAIFIASFFFGAFRP